MNTGKLFDANARDAVRFQQTPVSGEPVTPQASLPPAFAVAALGVTTPQGQTPPPQPLADPLSAFAPGQQMNQPAPLAAPAQQQANQNGQQVVDNYSSTIQGLAEEAYELARHNAVSDPTYLQSLIDSGDKTKMKLADKVLERNAQQFGAKSVDEYKAKLELDKAGDDPVRIELAQIKMEQARVKSDQTNRDWNSFKRNKKVQEGSEFDKLCDSVRKEYPSSPESDVLLLAQGRAGIDPKKYSTGGVNETIHGTPSGTLGDKGGGNMASETNLQALGIRPGVQASAERYLQGALTGNGIRK